MNILLTGSGGYIGSNLKPAFEAEHVLFAPRSFELDLTNTASVKKYFDDKNIDVIVHCSSVGGVREKIDSPETVELNLLMVENLLESKSNSCKFITFGSGAMYGKCRNLHRVSEEQIGDFEPVDLYGKSKLLIAKKINQRRDALCLNIFGCYGYNEKTSRFPTYAILQNFRKEPIEINQNVIFDYLWVEDLQIIVNYFISNWPVENIINITPDDSISLTEIAEIVNSISSFKSLITLKQAGFNNEYTGTNKILKKNYPNLVFTSYSEGLRKLFTHIRKTLY